MAASLASFASILKEFYLGPIQDQLNEETLVCDMFEKASVDWNGRQVIIPVHTARNTAVGYRAEGGALPGVVGLPGAPIPAQPSQGYSNLTVTAEFLYGRFVVTGPAMASAGKGGANSFVGWVDAEMTRLVSDIKNASNRTAVSGGTCIGFMTDNVGLGAVPAAVSFTGDAGKAGLLAAAPVDGDIDLVRMDTYASVLGGQTARVTAVGGGTITIGASGAIGGTVVVDAAGNAVPIAIIATAQGATAMAAAPNSPGDPRNEPEGIYGNVAQPTHFGVDRTTATGLPALQCGDGDPLAPTSNLVTTGNGAGKDALALASIQTVLDRITLASDEAPDVILCSPLQRTRLVALLQGTITFNSDVGSKGDAKMGFTGFSYAGLPVKTSRHVDNGAMWFVSTKSWKMLELQAGKFADDDGDVLSRVANADAFEGFYKWYYNITCVRPNANGALLNLAL